MKNQIHLNADKLPKSVRAYLLLATYIDNNRDKTLEQLRENLQHIIDTTVKQTSEAYEKVSDENVGDKFLDNSDLLIEAKNMLDECFFEKEKFEAKQ